MITKIPYGEFRSTDKGLERVPDKWILSHGMLISPKNPMYETVLHYDREAKFISFDEVQDYLAEKCDEDRTLIQ